MLSVIDVPPAYVEGVFPEICAKSYEVKRKRGRDDIQQRIVKQEKWSTNVCASSQSETLGEEPEGCEEGGGVAVWNLKGLRDFDESLWTFELLN